MNLTFETELEVDGRWLVEVPELPGVMAYGMDKAGAMTAIQQLARKVVQELKGAKNSNSADAI